MRSERTVAQAEVVNICLDHIKITHEETFTREEGEDTLGKSWTNISDLIVGGDSRVIELQTAIDELREKGYVVSMDSDSLIKIQVSISRDVRGRLGDDE